MELISRPSSDASLAKQKNMPSCELLMNISMFFLCALYASNVFVCVRKREKETKIHLTLSTIFWGRHYYSVLHKEVVVLGFELRSFCLPLLTIICCFHLLRNYWVKLGAVGSNAERRSTYFLLTVSVMRWPSSLFPSSMWSLQLLFLFWWMYGKSFQGDVKRRKPKVMKQVVTELQLHQLLPR